MDVEEIRQALGAAGKKRGRALRALDESRDEADELVPLAREAGVTWREIGTLLDRDPSAVQRDAAKREAREGATDG